MRASLLLVAAAVMLLGAPGARAGCLTGAAVGGVAGHVAGHGVLGAGAGCVAGHYHSKHVAQRKAASQQQGDTQNGTQQ